MAGRLEGRVAIVTGGTRGLGRAMVERFHAEGATVLLTYLKNGDMARAIENDCPGVRSACCDGRDRAAVDATVEGLVSRDGRVDVLVNNAGIVVNQFFAMMPPDDWERVLQANLGGAYNWARAVFRTMLIAKRGSILNIASVAGLVGVAGQTAYGASKGALTAFTRALAAEGSAKGVRVNCLAPGFVDTDMAATIPAQIRRAYLDRIPLRRFGTAEEIATAALFLVSDEASYVTGHTLVVDGGLSAIGI